MGHSDGVLSVVIKYVELASLAGGIELFGRACIRTVLLWFGLFG